VHVQRRNFDRSSEAACGSMERVLDGNGEHRSSIMRDVFIPLQVRTYQKGNHCEYDLWLLKHQVTEKSCSRYSYRLTALSGLGG
jgi:hypothetical protein